jgi:hypothetical protein
VAPVGVGRPEQDAAAEYVHRASLAGQVRLCWLIRHSIRRLVRGHGSAGGAGLPACPART